MVSRKPFYLLVALLYIVGLGMTIYHHIALDVPLTPGARTRLQLLRIAPGKALPDHGHGGEELTLILKGSYSDHTGRYGAGDVADLDMELEHAPRVDSDVECICVVATEAPTRFKSFWARLAQRAGMPFPPEAVAKDPT